MSEEIGLRVIEQEDLEFIHKLNNNPDIMSYWFEEPYKSMARLQDMYEKSMHNQQERRFILKKNNEKLGLVELVSIDPIHRKAEFTIMIEPTYQGHGYARDRKSTRLNSSHVATSYAVFCWNKKNAMLTNLDSRRS